MYLQGVPRYVIIHLVLSKLVVVVATQTNADLNKFGKTSNIIKIKYLFVYNSIFREHSL